MSTIDEKLSELENLKKFEQLIKYVDNETKHYYKHLNAGDLTLQTSISRITPKTNSIEFWVFLQVSTKPTTVPVFTEAALVTFKLTDGNVDDTVRQTISTLNQRLNQHLDALRPIITNYPNGLGGTE